MGQYYKPVSLDRKEYLYTHDYANGLKLMEHSYIDNSFMNVVEKLLAPEGPWYKNRIVWAGDYGDEKLFVPPHDDLFDEDGEKVEDTENINLYGYMSYAGTKISPEAAPEGSDYKERADIADKIEKDTTLIYVCNWSKKEYVDLTAVQPVGMHGWEANYKIHPLSILTCNGNGRGGGDFRGEHPLVGAWAADQISMEGIVPDGFKEITPNFEEDR
jgi:hypothetical protein